MNEVQEVVVLISKDLDVPLQNEIESINVREKLHSYLTLLIQELIDKDFNRLLVALYRIDIPETKVVPVLELENPEKIASTLADLVIDRELQKVKTRRKYKSG